MQDSGSVIKIPHLQNANVGFSFCQRKVAKSFDRTPVSETHIIIGNCVRNLDRKIIIFDHNIVKIDIERQKYPCYTEFKDGLTRPKGG